MKIIDSDKLTDSIIESVDVKKLDAFSSREILNHVMKKIKDAPSVKQTGAWTFNLTYRRFECSNCDGKIESTFQYCPFCGSWNGTECEDFDEEFDFEVNDHEDH